LPIFHFLVRGHRLHEAAIRILCSSVTQGTLRLSLESPARAS
jgi:hypothetical protein